MPRSTFTSHALRCAVFATALGAAASAQALDLTVEVLNAKSMQGAVNVALYGSAEGWLKADRMLQGARQGVAEKTVLVFRGLRAGPLAMAAFHDENGNGKLDTNLVGMPLERLGFSRNAVGFMGPAAFADAVIDLQADTTVTLTLR